MSETESKESTIKKVYENAASSYGSVRDTYIQANKINPGIRYVDVKEYLDTQQHRQTRFNLKGSNSFVSPHALFEIGSNLIDMTKKLKTMMDIVMLWLRLIRLLNSLMRYQ